MRGRRVNGWAFPQWSGYPQFRHARLTFLLSVWYCTHSLSGEVAMIAQHDTYNYTYRLGRRLSHRGITNNPARREREHRLVRPGGKLTIDGRAKTRIGALRAERRQLRTRGYYA